uniref:Elf4 domain-containing protein n=1 Tax=Steinernema glaseri TaxID=37863 RepID=A0A1I8ADW4_9BILA
MHALHRETMSRALDDHNSSQLSLSDKHKVIDQLVEEYRMLKHYLRQEQQEPDGDDLNLDVVLHLNRAALKNLCAQVGRSFDMLDLTGKKPAQESSAKDTPKIDGMGDQLRDGRRAVRRKKRVSNQGGGKKNEAM